MDTVINRFAQSHHEELEKLLMSLAQIPAPSLDERRRAVFCCDWLCTHGVTQAYIDEVNNVICPFGDVSGEVSIVMAHSDVVFPDATPLPLEKREGRLCCPGIGDDTANVVMLMMAAWFLCSEHKTPKNSGLLLVINAAEEGLGNLKGSKAIADAFDGRIKECISFDCHANELISGAVGSRRYAIEVNTRGGHSYFDFGRANAIVTLSKLIDALYSLPIPENTHTTMNVGTITGGTSVNTIAPRASMLFEFRSDDRDALQTMHDALMQTVVSAQCDDTTVSVEMIGERPCAERVDKEAMTALTQRASKLIQKHFGISPTVKDGSTDCNTFLSRGIPSVCFGCILGDGMHTREEYVLVDSLMPGLKTAIETVLYYCQ